MKRVIASLAAAAVLALPLAALADGAPPSSAEQPGKVVASNVVVEKAVVKGIDLQNRVITLLMPDGSLQAFYVDPVVQRLGEVQVGDTVKARYTEALSVKLNKSKVPGGVKVEQSVSRDEQSPMPAATQGLTVTTTATIVKIRDNGKKVTLRLPDGSASEVEVRDPENLAKIRRGEVKQGDQVEITYQRAMAVSVERAR